MEKKEIDLIELAKNLKTFISKNIWFFLILIILGGSTGFAYNKYKQPTFMTVGVFSTWVEEDLLNKLMKVFEHQFASGNYEYLSEKTKTPINNLKNISNIDYYTTIDESDISKHSTQYSLLDKSKTYIYIEVFGKQKDYLVNLEKTFNNYFLSNSNLYSKFQIRKNMLESLSEEISYELETHKSRNNKLINQTNSQNSIVYIDYPLSGILDLVKVQFEIQKELEKENIIYFEHDFSEPTEIKDNLKKSLLLFVFLFLLAGIIYKIIRNI